MRSYVVLASVLALVSACKGNEDLPDETATPEPEAARARASDGTPRNWGPPELGNAHPTGAPSAAGAPGAVAAPGAEPAAPPAEPFDAAHPGVGGMRWTVPAGFTYRAPATPMRLAEYVVGRAGDADVAMTVFFFPGMGGGIDANVQRWLGQFSQPDGRSTLSVARIGTETVGSMRVTTVDVGGHFDGGTMGGGTGDDYRLLAAIAEAPAGPVFFKLVGPRAVLEASEPAFRALVQSFVRATP